MFQFPGFASPTYEFSGRYRRSGGLPHSEIHGSKPARGSPWLIATCCVLHRLSVPRHPPDALQTLDLIGAYSTSKSPPTNAPRAGESPQGPTTSPQPHPAKMHHMTQPTDLPLPEECPAGSSSVTKFFTCQRSHTRRSGYLCSLSRISPRLPLGGSDCRVIKGHSPSLSALPGGGGRDRTDDLMLAKHALSQLSYAPTGKDQQEQWWAREDLNFRPHAYQARALTN